MGKGIGRTYKCDHQNWHYPYLKTTFTRPPRFDTYIKPQHNSASDASEGANDDASAGLDQTTKHHVNTDFNNNHDSKSFETSRGGVPTNRS